VYNVPVAERRDEFPNNFVGGPGLNASTPTPLTSA
jgi:hypothetical protein